MSFDDMGWKLLMPVGFLTVVVSLVGGVSYLASRRGTAEAAQSESPVALLEKQHARGNIDEEEFQRRRANLSDDE
jgi:putative membrane protein